MAWAKGTATDFVDFLRILRDYASGVLIPGGSPSHGLTSGTQVGGGDAWTVLDDTLPASGMATDGELYLRGQGAGGSPQDEIYCNFKTYRNAGNNQFSWEMRGATGYNSGLTFTTQPGVSSPAYSAFDDVSLPIHLWVNSRRIMALAQIGSTNVLVHAGFIQQFSTRSQYPYPLLITGSQMTSTSNAQVNNFGHSCLPDVANDAGYLRWVDGTWLEWANYSNASATRASAKSSVISRNFWPNQQPTSHPNGGTGSGAGEGTFWENYTVTGALLTAGDTGALPLIPVCLMSDVALVGRVDGLYTVPGQGLVTGDTIVDTSVSPNKTYDVYSNTYRSEQADYFAILRE